MRLCHSQWLLILAVAGAAGAGQGAGTCGTLFEGRATESMVVTVDPETGGAFTRQSAVNFHQLSYLKAREEGMIARETIATDYLEGTEGGTSTATVALYYGHANKRYSAEPDHVTTVTAASEIQFNGDHWTATITGCCDSETFLQMFDYGKSVPFLYANSRYAQVNVPNAKVDRYMSVVLRAQTPEGPMNAAIFGKHDKAVAAILYGAPGMPMERLLLQARPGVGEDKLPYHTDTLTLKSVSSKDEDGFNEDKNVSKVLTLWSQDPTPPAPPPSSVSGFSIIATFGGNEGKPDTVVVPIEKDRFGKARVTGGALMVAD